ncbi:MAG: hypothetical protein ACO3Z6_02465 [Pseudomonadales bacterium]
MNFAPETHTPLDAPGRVALGDRVHVYGSSCSGKSTLGAELAERLDCPFVELDAMNWLPGWVGLDKTDPEAFSARIRSATMGPRWIVAGSYTRHSQETFWPHLDTLIFLDLPRWQLIVRVIRRSWRRWRTRELLWGTNYENFWTQLAIWRGEESLIWWIWTNFAKRRHQVAQVKADPRWSHIRVIHLQGAREIEQFRRRIGLPPR